MISIEREPTFRTALSNGMNLFLGAGFSVLAQSANRGNLPVGNTLQTELCHEFARNDLAALPLPRLYDVLFHEKPTELTKFLKERFTVTTFDPKYKNILSVNITSIITTNIDDLVYKVFATDPRRYLNDVVIGGAAFKAVDAIDYIPLHGSVVHTEENYTFGTLDLASAFARDPDRFHFLTQRVQRTPTLFCGYSLSDAGSLQALDRRSIEGRDHQHKWVQLHNPIDAEIKYFKALGFSIIIATTEELLDFVGSWAPPITTPTELVLHKYERIPAITDVKSRSLSEFYLGSPPVWHDILVNRLKRLSYFNQCEDYVNERKNVYIVGIPQSGKSTLLMQLAAFSNVPGEKIMLESAEIGKVQSLISRLGGRPATIFIDDAANSAEVLDHLTDNNTLTVVAADQHFNVENASHKFERGRFKVIDVSDLTPQDMRDVYESMPADMRQREMRVPQMSAGRNPSLYELISSNTRGTKLAERFAKCIRDMEFSATATPDLFLMMCYVHSCRTPASFDMAWAFLRARQYTEVYAEITKLGALLSEYGAGHQILVDDDQDYYNPRSVYVAQAVLNACTREAFERMFLRFHQNVSNFRIAQFDVFRRYGYDSAYALRAFLKADDGIAFYNDAFERDGSYYLLQQKAIYLARLKMFKEAFVTIDEALLQSGGRIPSIRHSHAEILFDANINLALTDDGARPELQKSLRILEECRRYDKRKAYHAFKFADEACKYFDAYRDEEAVSILRQAESWLQEELVNPFVARRARSHLKGVQQRLA